MESLNIVQREQNIEIQDSFFLCSTEQKLRATGVTALAGRKELLQLLNIPTLSTLKSHLSVKITGYNYLS